MSHFRGHLDHQDPQLITPLERRRMAETNLKRTGLTAFA